MVDRAIMRLAMRCPSEKCPARFDVIWVPHSYSTGKYWPPDLTYCKSCGADLKYEDD